MLSRTLGEAVTVPRGWGERRMVGRGGGSQGLLAVWRSGSLSRLALPGLR